MQKMKDSGKNKDKNQLELSCSTIFSSTCREQEEFTKKVIIVVLCNIVLYYYSIQL